MSTNTHQISCALLLSVLLGGCTTYMTPGAGVSIPEITTPFVADAMARKPAATFPARIVIVRVQGAGYQSTTNRGYGRGAYSVITSRDIETEADFTRLAAMPEVAAVGGVNRLVLPAVINSVDDLREAAATLQADIVLIYTIDTAFRTETQQIGPMQLISLGFFPNKKAKVSSTCAVAFIDTRTGFIYGVAESTANEEKRSDLWNKEEAIDKARTKAERAAFTAALGEVEKLWSSIAGRYGRSVGGASNSIPTAP
jgi:hypothetical protein